MLEAAAGTVTAGDFWCLQETSGACRRPVLLECRRLQEPHSALQSGIGIGGNKIEILHFRNGDKIKANAALENKPQIVFFLSSSNYDPKKMRELSKHSLFVGNGRKFITESKGDIAFNYSRNRVRLIISKLALTRRSPKLNSQISRLRSVVEIIPSN